MISAFLTYVFSVSFSLMFSVFSLSVSVCVYVIKSAVYFRWSYCHSSLLGHCFHQSGRLCSGCWEITVKILVPVFPCDNIRFLVFRITTHLLAFHLIRVLRSRPSACLSSHQPLKTPPACPLINSFPDCPRPLHSLLSTQILLHLQSASLCPSRTFLPPHSSTWSLAS